MQNTIIYSIIYIIGELLPIDGQAHLKLYSYYFNKSMPSEFTYNFIYLSLILGIFIFLLKDVLLILKESFKAINNLRTGRSSFDTVCSEYKQFNLFVFIVFIFLINFLIIRYFNFVFELSVNNYLLSFLLIISGAMLFLSRYFAVVKVFPFLFNIKELIIFALINFVCIIPGFSRMALMLSSATVLGFEKKYAYKFSLLSLFVFLTYFLFIRTNFDISFFESIVFTNYLYILLINVFFILIILKIFYNLIASIRVTRFYLYLFILGLWTILDLYFSKRGL